MSQRWMQPATRQALSPHGRRTVEQLLGRARTVTAGSGRGAQVLRTVDSLATRQRLERRLERLLRACGGGR